MKKVLSIILSLVLIMGTVVVIVRKKKSKNRLVSDGARRAKNKKPLPVARQPICAHKCVQNPIIKPFPESVILLK